MFISYAPLWQTLQKKSLKKTDLLELTGMSSRTLAKLSANESVTVETLAKLCEVLGCPVEEILAISDTCVPASLYDAFRQKTDAVSENDHFTVREVPYEGRIYRIWFSKKKADRLTVVRCQENGVVEWQKKPFNYRLNGGSYGEALPVFEERVKPEKGIFTVVVINGKPGAIEGLDAGVIRSAGHPGDDSHVHVMSLARFKTFAV